MLQALHEQLAQVAAELPLKASKEDLGILRNNFVRPTDLLAAAKTISAEVSGVAKDITQWLNPVLSQMLARVQNNEEQLAKLTKGAAVQDRGLSIGHVDTAIRKVQGDDFNATMNPEAAAFFPGTVIPGATAAESVHMRFARILTKILMPSFCGGAWLDERAAEAYESGLNPEAFAETLHDRFGEEICTTALGAARQVAHHGQPLPTTPESVTPPAARA